MTKGSLDDPISPRRHDEIGAVAACLEICRQVATHGSARLAGAIRLRGDHHDFTAERDLGDAIAERVPALGPLRSQVCQRCAARRSATDRHDGTCLQIFGLSAPLTCRCHT
jgi:hypothetical protein